MSVVGHPRIPRAKTSLLLHPQPRRPRASLPRSLLPASSQERLPAAAAAVLLARSSCSPLPPLRRAIAGAAAAVLLLPHRCAPLFPTSFFPDRASPTRISRRSRLWPLLRRRNRHRPQPAAVLLLPHRRGCPPHGLLLRPAAGATPRPRRSRRRIVLLPLGPVRISVLHLRRSPLSLSLFARDSIPSLAAALAASPSPIPPCLLGLMVEGRGLPSVEGYSRSPSTAPASEDQAAAIEPNQADKLS
ncbi:hypothetical protein DAI22_02g333700 [Oryza sativa Japonica Group]|nr:hypothetical protein DAI22_02g333700 [Oryza sativa Japonica Group]